MNTPFSALINRHSVKKGVVSTAARPPGAVQTSEVAIGGFDAEFLQGINGHVVEAAPDGAAQAQQQSGPVNLASVQDGGVGDESPRASSGDMDLDFLNLHPSIGAPRAAVAPAPSPAPARTNSATVDHAGVPGGAHSNPRQAGPSPAPATAADPGPAQDATTHPRLDAAGAALFGKKSPFAKTQAQRQYVSTASPLSHMAGGNSEAVRELRKDIKAANIVTQLIAAISRYPGSQVPVGVKTQILANLLVHARRAAVRVATVVDPERCNYGWVRAQALEMMVLDVARHWEQMASMQGAIDQSLDERAIAALNERSECVVHVLSEPHDELREALNTVLEGAQYNAVTDEQSARDHRLTAVNRLAWMMSDLTASAQVDFGSSRMAVLQVLCTSVLDIVNTCKPEIGDPEAASSYFGGACLRVTKLIQAEFASRIQALLSQPGAQAPLRMDANKFEQEVLPTIVDSVRRDFQSIENAARALLSTLDRHETNNLRGGADR